MSERAAAPRLPSAAIAADPIESLAAAVRSRIEGQRRAEEHLAAFAFTEGPGDGHAAASPGSVDWRFHVARALHAVADPASLDLLILIAGSGLTIDELMEQAAARVAALTSDRLAIAEWVSGLAAAGVVVRQLETDRVRLTPLGEALVALVDEIERRAAANEP